MCKSFFYSLLLLSNIIAASAQSERSFDKRDYERPLLKQRKLANCSDTNPLNSLGTQRFYKWTNDFMLDVIASDKADMSIEVIDVMMKKNTYIGGCGRSAQILSKEGTHKGFESNAPAWEDLLYEGTVCVPSQADYISLSFTTPVTIPKGTSRAFYVRIVDHLEKEMLVGPGPNQDQVVVQDEYLSILEGTALSNSFSPGSSSSNSLFGGRIKYRLCEEPPQVTLCDNNNNTEAVPTPLSLGTTIFNYQMANGVMYSMKAKNDVTINNIQVFVRRWVGTDPASYIIQVWTKEGTYEGFEQDSSAWTVVYAQHTTLPLSQTELEEDSVNLVFSRYVSIPTGSTQSFYVTLFDSDNENIRVASAKTASGYLAYGGEGLLADANLIVYPGVVVNGNFGTTLSGTAVPIDYANPVMVSGRLDYSLCKDKKTPSNGALCTSVDKSNSGLTVVQSNDYLLSDSFIEVEASADLTIETMIVLFKGPLSDYEDYIVSINSFDGPSDQAFIAPSSEWTAHYRGSLSAKGLTPVVGVPTDQFMALDIRAGEIKTIRIWLPFADENVLFAAVVNNAGAAWPVARNPSLEVRQASSGVASSQLVYQTCDQEVIQFPRACPNDGNPQTLSNTLFNPFSMSATNGIMFNVETSAEIEINGLSVAIFDKSQKADIAGATVHVYTRPGSYDGYEDSVEGWELAYAYFTELTAETIVSENKIYRLANISFQPIQVAANSVQALYILVQSGGGINILHDSVSKSLTTMEDDKVAVYPGISLSDDFVPIISGNLGTSFLGTLDYDTCGDDSASVPAGPTPTESSQPNSPPMDPTPTDSNGPNSSPTATPPSSNEPNSFPTGTLPPSGSWTASPDKLIIAMALFGASLCM